MIGGLNLRELQEKDDDLPTFFKTIKQTILNISILLWQNISSISSSSRVQGCDMSTSLSERFTGESVMMTEKKECKASNETDIWIIFSLVYRFSFRGLISKCIQTFPVDTVIAVTTVINREESG